MGHIKEPEGVDFIIETKPFTNEERQKISEFIRKDKANNAGNTVQSFKPKKKLITKKSAVNK